jgi:hypothetical protein
VLDYRCTRFQLTCPQSRRAAARFRQAIMERWPDSALMTLITLAYRKCEHRHLPAPGAIKPCRSDDG